MAAPGDLAHGTVVVDSNKNGVIDAGPTGSNDTPIGGVKVTLKGSDPNIAGVDTVTAPDGTWSFAPSDATTAGPGPYTVVIDAAGVNGNAYLTPLAPAAGVNGFTRVSGEPQQSVSAPFNADANDIALNALVYPTWSTSVIPAEADDGLGGNAIWTGTGPFDPNDTTDGFDTGTANNRVRTSDVINHSWSIAVDAEQDLGSDANIWFEQELVLEPGAVANFGIMPVSCVAGSQIIGQPGNVVLTPRQTPPAGTTSVTLKCNLGPMGDSKSAALLDTQVFVDASSVNGATFTEKVRTYGATPDGVTTARPDGDHEYGPFEITAAPRYDIQKQGKFMYGGFSEGKIGNTTILDDDGNPVIGKYIYYSVAITTERRVGVEAFQQPINFEEALWGQYKNGSNGPEGTVNAGMEWYLTSCAPWSGDPRQAQGELPYGKIGMPTAGGGQPSDASNSVRDSGTCSFTRQDSSKTSNYDVQLTGIDASGASYPSKSVNGTAINNKYFVGSYEIVVFVPRAEIDKMVGAPNDGVGVVDIYNRVGNFNPVGVSGAPNYGGDGEPGYCAAGPNSDAQTHCDKMPNGANSNNVTGPVEIKISPGVWSKEYRDLTQEWGFRSNILPGASGSHAGNGQVQPGQTYTSVIGVSPEAPSPNPQFCDVFDNTVLKLSPLGNDATIQNQQYGGAFSQVTYQAAGTGEINTKIQEAYQANWVVMYGHVDLTGDDPNTGTLAGDSRYTGNWTTQKAASKTACADPAGFYANPSDVPGGIDAVNVVWAKAIDGYIQPATSTVRLLTGLEQRDTYNGGPHDGTLIPANTISANFGNVKSDTFGDWITNPYIPGAGNTGGVTRTGESAHTTGDRWSLVRAEMSLKKWTVAGTVNGVQATGASADGVTGSARAGTPVIWYLNPTLTAASTPASPVNNVTITDTLPAGVEFDAEGTASLGTLAPASVTKNANGTTTIVWNLGTRTPNETIAPLQIATLVDPFLPNNTTVINNASMKADGIAPENRHKDDHRVTVTQPGSLALKKSVDHILDLQDKDQVFTLEVKNFSEQLRIQAPTIIDVLPYNGDATNAALVNRSPASAYSGTNKLAAAPTVTLSDGSAAPVGTFYYTTINPALVPQNLNADTDPTIWSTTFTADATAFKFVAGAPLGNVSEGASSGLRLTYQTLQNGNEAGDLYANRFTAFSPTLRDGAGAFQLLTSNQVTVRVVGFSLGDLIWFDNDNSGTFTPGVDTAAPQGVKVEVYKADGTLVGNVTTNKDGRWVINDLPEGDYYAVIPASEFAAGGPLEGWIAQTEGYEADPNTDVNEGGDHNGLQDGATVKTGNITLSATVNGNTITGNEPLGDNVGNLPVTPGTTDGFTNFTLDIALRPVPKYEFTKVANPVSGTAVDNGKTITYTLEGKNTGKTPLTVEITDDLTEVLKYATVTTAPASTMGAAPTLTGNDLLWTGSLKPGESVKVTYTVTVGEGHAGKIIANHAVSTATPPYDPPLPPIEGETHHPIPGFTFAKEADPAHKAAVQPSDEITYTLRGTNTGATVLDPVTITDDLSKVLNNATIDPASITATIAGVGMVPDATLNGTTLEWTGRLPVGREVVITYTVKVNADAWGVLLENLATGEATPPGLSPITPSPGKTEHPTPKYEFTKVSDPVSTTPVAPGVDADGNPTGEITYTLTGINSGKTVLDPVVITDDLSNVLNNATVTVEPVATIAGVDAADRAAADAQRQ